jgi:uncharacterized protein YfaS (alpha-2-macroglobulin family)
MMSSKPLRRRLIAACVLLALGTVAGLDAAEPGQQVVKRPAGTVIVPDKFLRRWDPVTLFFDHDFGPATGGAEHAPERLVAMSPSQPGAFTWLNGHTLQFRPAEPWAPLSRTRWALGDRTVELATLMSGPTATVPENGAEGLAPVERIVLTLPEPIDAALLKKVLTIELRSLPGTQSDPPRLLNAADYDIKIGERVKRDDSAQYTLILREPIAGGIKTVVKLRLSPEPTLDAEFFELNFSTRPPFRVTSVGCASPARQATQSDFSTPSPDQPPPPRNDDEANAGEGEGEGEGEAAAPPPQPAPEPRVPTRTIQIRSADTAPIPASGVAYAKDDALTCGGEDRSMLVRFSSRLDQISPVAARNLVRVTPSVEDLSFAISGDTLVAQGKFKSGVTYGLRLEPTSLADAEGRALAMAKPSQLYFAFAEQPKQFRWGASDGIAERFGPRMLPVQARGYEKLDVRIHKIDPLDLSFWPMANGVVTDDQARPPGPGEGPERASANQFRGNDQISQWIGALGSPSVSEIVTLPRKRGDSGARFGLDVAPLLDRISGHDAPGTYLIGARALDQTQRSWLRLQVTDLSLSTVEEDGKVHFFVTSLRSAGAVAGAVVRLEGVDGKTMRTLEVGRTDGSGDFVWTPPRDDGDKRRRPSIARITVAKDDDILTIAAERSPPELIHPAVGRPGGDPWLNWPGGEYGNRFQPAQVKCHVFPDRPIYRPEEAVHIKGYIRAYDKGALNIREASPTVVVTGPNNLEWRYPVTLNANGSFHLLFNEKIDVTDVFNIHLDLGANQSCGAADFRKEAYRLPDFEVRLTSPDIVPLDASFPVKLSASYYAGGQVTGRPVRWRVTEFPYSWKPKTDAGFLYSTNTRYSGDQPFDQKAALETVGKTDDQGSAEIPLNPAAEKTAQPRRYVVEATVTGADDRTVTGTRDIIALPSFILGIKAPRYLDRAHAIEPEIVALGPDGKPLAGQDITVRLKQRQWHSILQASDFTGGIAKYMTDTVDEPRGEKQIKSKAEPLKLALPIAGSGVYVVELEAQDKIGRRQTVSVDLFVGGDTPVTWSRPPAANFKATADKDSYKPGDTASIVLESPFQTASALVVVERPDGHNRYNWYGVANGTATVPLVIEKQDMPGVPVHVVLMRGRLGSSDTANGDGTIDLRKPTTLVANLTLAVAPVKNTVAVDLAYPEKVQPGEDIDLTVKLADDTGKPIAGEVTLWLVDSAVLALRKEARLDPLPDFIVEHPARLSVRDTRNLVLGMIPLEETPGGDQRGEGDVLDTATIRKNFTPLPYYNPDLAVDASGQATVHIHMPDNLTNYKIRAKVVSGPDRFGIGTGKIAVRLPVQVQPALPRFVRPGDQFVLSALGRTVDGIGGPGRAELRVEGLTLTEGAKRDLTWQPSTPQRIDFPATVGDPGYGADGKLSRESVTVTVGAERIADHRKDAFQVTLPLRPDRRATIERQLAEIAPDQPAKLAAISEPARPGTLKRTVLLSASSNLLRVAAALDYLLEYPFGCTEQRVSRARAELAAKRLDDVLMSSSPERLEVDIKATLAYLKTVINDDGLASFWPGSKPSVALTAWVAEFMAEAQSGGYTVEPGLRDRVIHGLKAALRSDSPFLYPAEAYGERVWALTGLAELDALDQGYAAEFARRASMLDVESVAQVLQLLQKVPGVDPATLDGLRQRVWKGIVFRLDHGKEAYGGLQNPILSRGPIILPSEARTLAHIIRATTADSASTPRRELIVNTLIRSSGATGWGDTNANAETLLALLDVAGEAPPGTPPDIDLAFGAAHDKVSLSQNARVQKRVSFDPGEASATILAPKSDTPPAALLAETRYVAAAPGSEVAASTSGFAVTRTAARVVGDALEKLPIDQPGTKLALTVGDVVEDSVEIVNPENRHFVAIVLPIAAGMEPLNPALETAPPEATPSIALSLKPSYVAFLDDQVAYYYDELPKGTYRFATRARATVPGRFSQPAAYAVSMYREAENGNSNGASVIITRADNDPAQPPPAQKKP